MDQAEFTLSRPVCLSLPIEEVDKLLQEKDGRCALAYLALLRAGGKPFPAESIGLTERELRQTMERLCALGLVSAAGRAAPAPAGRTAAAADNRPVTAEPKLMPAAELPQYTAEDISSRMLSDEPMQTVRREAEQLYGRKLTTPEMNMLLGPARLSGSPGRRAHGADPLRLSGIPRRTRPCRHADDAPDRKGGLRVGRSGDPHDGAGGGISAAATGAAGACAAGAAGIADP